MSHPVITIEDRPPTTEGRVQRWLKGRRIAVAGVLAAAEVLVYLIRDPNRWFGLLVVGALLALCLALSGRVKPGLSRDLLLIGAMAQGMVIALPILAGVVKLVVAAILVFALIALFISIGLRFRR